MNHLIATISGNTKIGPGVASTSRLVGPTCPKTCPLLGNGCYAQRGRVAMVQHNLQAGKVGTDEDTPKALDRLSGVALIRHLVAGDWLKPTKDGRRVADRGFLRAVFAWHRKPTQRHTIGWGYSHAPEQLQRAGFGPDAFPPNLEILASCHSADHAKQLQSAGWRTARVIDSIDAKAPNEVLCPFDLAKHQKRPTNVTCASCRLCMPGSKHNIAFLKF